MASRLQVTDFSLFFENKCILQDISFTLNKQEVVGLIGPAAVGKSSLLKTIAGLYESPCGAITKDIPPETEAIGMAFQNNALFDFLNVFENVAFPLRSKRCFTETQINLLVMKALTEVGLRDSAQSQPKELSGGMQRRVGIARAIVSSPALLLFDDPTAGLDPVTSSLIFKLIITYTTSHDATAIIVSSDVTTLCHWVKRLLILNNQQLVYDGPTSEVMNKGSTAVKEFISGKKNAEKINITDCTSN